MDSSGYVRQEDSMAATPAETKRLYPAVGDIVRFYDLDGGQSKGQLLVGRISFIQKNLGKEASGWSVEISELDNVGSGYYADYPFQQRRSKKTMRDLAAVSPIAASFVRAEDAFKIPLEADGRTPRVRAERYDIEDYPGPFAGGASIDQTVVETDALAYGSIKAKLLRYTALAGVIGAIVADLTKGTEDAVIYAAGAFASLVYLFFLTVKTDTLASPEAKLGKNVANLRFLTPLLVLVGVALYNKSRGDDNPALGNGVFGTVTAEQFGAAILGFLTYRIPLFLSQIQDAFNNEDGETILPGSVGVAMQLATKSSSSDKSPPVTLDSAAQVATILLVSGPQATGRSKLVQRFIEGGKGRFVQASMVDRVQEAAKFERLFLRDEFLSVDATERYGLTKDAILSAAKQCGPDSVVVVDSDVKLAKKLAKVGGLRLVGVWVALNSVAEFEKRLDAMINDGSIPVPEDEDRESVIRARIREIVEEITFGISSGIFEFTIINQDEDESLRQLEEAAGYCFK
jgi:guanylate kinase